ncbi:hypothetical protein [Halorubrum laminariae]|uniref:Uncharacterized protein n=1 Tax=Halorubrum laminariae TaxID=1433523 RepID=A0ABD6C1S9_9EURY|nr:hypothetical protein [Halorubrum laminariae]
MRPGRIAVDGVPVFVCTRPELDIVEITDCGVVSVTLRLWGKSAGGNRLSTRKWSVVLLGAAIDWLRMYYDHDEHGPNRHREAR